MSKKEKLIERVISLSKDITFEELVIFLSFFDFKLSTKGKTSGSRVVFYNDDNVRIYLHKPHPNNIMKICYIKEILYVLKKEGLLWLAICIIKIMLEV